jgi:microcystin-dependent protein
MGLPTLNTDLNINQLLPDQPGTQGYTAPDMKELLDKAPNIIKTFLNDTFIPAIDALLANIDTSSSVGQIEWFATDTAPPGRLVADGTAVSRTTYARLFNVIGTRFGSGDGATTFNLPDLTKDNRYVRAAGGSLTVGMLQEDDFKAHAGHFDDQAGTYYLDKNIASTHETSAYLIVSGNELEPSTKSLGGAETRPKSMAALACIRY